jgi:hypothetical protein
VVLHAFEGKAPFSPETLKVVSQLRAVYGVDYDATHAHRLVERGEGA